MRHWIVAVVFGLLGACAQHWEKPGGTAAELQATSAACGAQAATAFPPRMETMQVSAGYTRPSTTYCTGARNNADCRSRHREYVPPTYSTVDRNQGSRDQHAESCLMANGWTQVPRSLGQRLGLEETDRGFPR